MKTIFIALGCLLFAWTAIAQNEVVTPEPTLAPTSITLPDEAPSRASDPIAPSLAPVKTYYPNGMKFSDGYRSLGRNETMRLLRNTPAYDAYRTGVRYNKIGGGLLWPGVGLSGAGVMCFSIAFIYNAAYDFDDYFDESGGNLFWESGGAVGMALLLVGLPLVATGATFKVMAKHKIAQAVWLYNDYANTSASVYTPTLTFGPTARGLGLTYKF